MKQIETNFEKFKKVLCFMLFIKQTKEKLIKYRV